MSDSELGDASEVRTPRRQRDFNVDITENLVDSKLIPMTIAAFGQNLLYMSMVVVVVVVLALSVIGLLLARGSNQVITSVAWGIIAVIVLSVMTAGMLAMGRRSNRYTYKDKLGTTLGIGYEPDGFWLMDEKHAAFFRYDVFTSMFHLKGWVFFTRRTGVKNMGMGIPDALMPRDYREVARRAIRDARHR